ncbi:Uncharacterised protein [Salmonella enterica subsp. enterica]|uniref:Uncharacterized protein n=1 Tax=Salmonella enterica I TaxID=59201 RepID=A0A379WV18_SALET|nr:Uncharacterised protein [Salmonella enterica subsp. enterica]
MRRRSQNLDDIVINSRKNFSRVNLVRSGVIYTRFSFLLITYLSNLDCLPQPLSVLMLVRCYVQRHYDEERKDRPGTCYW